jgi:DNA polymerase (family X)
LHAAAGLAWVEPELCENTGEIEMAQLGKRRELVRDEDNRGFVHCHTRYSDGRSSIEELARSAAGLGMTCLTITVTRPRGASGARSFPLEKRNRVRHAWIGKSAGGGSKST